VRRAFLCGLVWAGLLVTVATPVFAQEHAEEAQEPENTLGPWRIANTLLFAIGFGFLLYKTAPKFFNARSADIQKAIKEATGLKIDADFRYSEVDRKMATLSDEVKRMREASAAEMEREHQRLRRDTAGEAERIRQHVANEIDAFRSEGMRRLRQQTAQAALRKAEQRLRERLGAGETDDSVGDFVRAVERGTR
jgi:F-type H+-transporting ATPase subunit b